MDRKWRNLKNSQALCAAVFIAPAVAANGAFFNRLSFPFQMEFFKAAAGGAHSRFNAAATKFCTILINTVQRRRKNRLGRVCSN